MNDHFDEQKDVLLAIKREINLLQQQVDFLIRNGKSLGLLDLDVLMNRTHTLYDLLCGVDLGSEELGDDEELPVGLEEIRAMFGIEETENGERRTENGKRRTENGERRTENGERRTENERELPEEEEPLKEETEEEVAEEDESAYFIEEADDEIQEEVEEPAEEAGEEAEEEAGEETGEPAEVAEVAEEAEVAVEAVEEPIEEPIEEPTEEPGRETSDDLGFILNFEPVEETENGERRTENEGTVFTTGDQIEMTIQQEEEEIVYEPVVIGDMTDHDDSGFELEQPETVGERYQQGQEETLGERLQHSSVRDLQSAIGINDKFLFVNELFGGSMEKYNRSIENLNDLKTLNGALIYLNELRIELQWNSSNEAYKKLLELVHRKFEN